MKDLKVGDIVIGKYVRSPSPPQPIYGRVTRLGECGYVWVVFTNPYGKEDELPVKIESLCLPENCHNCAHRLSRLVASTCPIKYHPLQR